MYLSQELHRFAAVLEADISPLDELVVLNPRKSSINIWIGMEGVVAPCHYDGYNNIYVQVKGQKRFYLAAPESRTTLRPFPFLHPSHAQCQVRLGPETVPVGNESKHWYVADLEPGDILFLPPMWFHEVHAPGFSVSVNGWTEHAEVEVVGKLFNLALPKHRSNRGWEPGHAVLALNAVFNRVLAAPDNTHRFWYRLWRDRYEELVRSGELPGQAALAAPVCRFSGAVAKAGLMGMKSFVRRASKLLLKLQPQTREVWMRNYAEAVLLSVLSGKGGATGGELIAPCVEELAHIMPRTQM